MGPFGATFWVAKWGHFGGLGEESRHLLTCTEPCTWQNDRNGAGTKRAFRSVVGGFVKKGVKKVVEFHQLEKRGSVQVPGLRAFEPRGLHALITGAPKVAKWGHLKLHWGVMGAKANQLNAL